MAAFKALVKTNMSADVLRSLALFITYSLHKNNPAKPLRVKKSNVQLRRQPTLGVGIAGATLSPVKSMSDLSSDGLTRQQIGVMVLEMFQDLLFEDGNGVGNIKKFARTVTNKVCILKLFSLFWGRLWPRGTFNICVSWIVVG
jgi:hypothetical protein